MAGYSKVDGNALAGVFVDLFAGDITSMTGVCNGCGTAAPFAECVVELDDVAAIARCRTCTSTLFTVFHGDGRGVRLVLGSLGSFAAAP